MKFPHCAHSAESWSIYKKSQNTWWNCAKRLNENQSESNGVYSWHLSKMWDSFWPQSLTQFKDYFLKNNSKMSKITPTTRRMFTFEKLCQSLGHLANLIWRRENAQMWNLWQVFCTLNSRRLSRTAKYAFEKCKNEFAWLWRLRTVNLGYLSASIDRNPKEMW